MQTYIVQYNEDGTEYVEMSPLVFSNGLKGDGTVYSDRLHQWDHKKHNELCMKHFGNQGQYWSEREPSKIESFLRDYMNNPKLVLCKIEEHTNVSNGYPYWYFEYLKGTK